ncbi:MAG: hypothetical protein ACTSWY_05285 [Promethearchaeota archaeon]
MGKKKQNYVRWYCKKCKQNLKFNFSEELKKKFLKAANNIFPYPVVIAHRDHYSIIHLDSNFQVRDSLITEIFLDLKI